MKILTPRNNKDYYDYLTGIYGEDEKIVYDRRAFTVLTNHDSLLFSYVSTPKDSPKRGVRRSQWVGNRLKKVSVFEGTDLFCILEVGFKWYSFQVERYLDTSGTICLDWKLLEVKEVTKEQRAGKTPMTLFTATSRYSFLWKDEAIELVIDRSSGIPNPILAGTPITSFIEVQDVYQELSRYMSSLNDIEIIDGRTDVEKVESAGFDRKTSFRNIK